MRTDARTNTTTRVIARAITAADMIVVQFYASSDEDSDGGSVCHQNQGVVETSVFVSADGDEGED